MVLDSSNVDDSFYFNDLPSKADVIKAISAHGELAPEYSWFYEKLKRATELFSWPTVWSNGLSETGKGVWFDNAEKLKRPPDVYIRIGRFNVIEVVE